MKRKIILKYFQKVNQLSFQNPTYQKNVDLLFKWLIYSDQVNRDRTTDILLTKKSYPAKAKIFCRERITLAGVEEIKYLIKKFTHLQLMAFYKDGAIVQAGQSIIELQGNAKEILAYERVVLNILQRLSGIATETTKIISQLKSLSLTHLPFIAATRKTPWGLLDKKSVALGGGLTHRLHLNDGVLIKDNHLVLLQKELHLKTEDETVAIALKKYLKNVGNQLIEIEVETKKSVMKLIDMFINIKTNNVLGILLDNFSVMDVKKIVNTLKTSRDLSQIIFEASGGINNKNIVRWARSGVDLISLGALTHSAKAVDISMEVNKLRYICDIDR